jgi:hypothetical protein
MWSRRQVINRPRTLAHSHGPRTVSPPAAVEGHNGTMTYLPASTRYDAMQYRRSGRSGLQLPAMSVGLWQNFGHDRPIDSQRAVIHRAFDMGITPSGTRTRSCGPHVLVDEPTEEISPFDVGTPWASSIGAMLSGTPSSRPRCGRRRL